MSGNSEGDLHKLLAAATEAESKANAGGSEEVARRVPRYTGLRQDARETAARATIRDLDNANAALPIADPYAPKARPSLSASSADPASWVATELRAKAEIYQERNALYGDNYKRFGPILSLMLAGQTLNVGNASDMNRLGILVQVVAKLTRYGENFNRGGHDDSLDDIAVYSMMLKELDTLAREG